MFFLKSEKT